MSVEEYVDHAEVYFYGFPFPNNGQDFRDRPRVRVIMHEEGYFRQVQESHETQQATTPKPFVSEKGSISSDFDSPDYDPIPF